MSLVFGVVRSPTPLSTSEIGGGVRGKFDIVIFLLEKCVHINSRIHDADKATVILSR